MPHQLLAQWQSYSKPVKNAICGKRAKKKKVNLKMKKILRKITKLAYLGLEVANVHLQMNRITVQVSMNKDRLIGLKIIKIKDSWKKLNTIFQILKNLLSL